MFLMNNLCIKKSKDGSGIDGTLQVREMIVMKLPIERKLARDKYYKEKNVISVDEQTENAKKAMGGGYGEIKQQQVTYSK